MRRFIIMVLMVITILLSRVSLAEEAPCSSERAEAIALEKIYDECIAILQKRQWNRSEGIRNDSESDASYKFCWVDHNVSREMKSAQAAFHACKYPKYYR